MTDNIVVLRLPQGQTGHRERKEEGIRRKERKCGNLQSSQRRKEL